MKPLVTKCICSNITFAEMKDFMSKMNIRSSEELFRKMKVAENCTLCVPYIKKMTETGKTKFCIIRESGVSDSLT